MFWKSDFWTKSTKKSIHRLSPWLGVTDETVELLEPMFRDTKLAELGDVEDVEKDVEALKKLSAQIERKLNLILDHLNLEYVRETEKKEPAKLVEKKKNPLFDDLSNGSITYSAGTGWPYLVQSPDPFDKPKKKKRGQPKKK